MDEEKKEDILNNQEAVKTEAVNFGGNSMSHDGDLSGESVQFLTFNVDGSEYGVDIMRVMEIRGWGNTTRIPNSPDYMRGVINLRGLVIPIFDLRARFSQGKTEVDEKNVVIVIKIGERTIGVLVDAVSDILTVGVDEVKEAPSSADTGIDDVYINGLISVEDKMVILLDVDYLFDMETLKKAEEVAV